MVPLWHSTKELFMFKAGGLLLTARDMIFCFVADSLLLFHINNLVPHSLQKVTWSQKQESLLQPMCYAVALSTLVLKQFRRAEKVDNHSFGTPVYCRLWPWGAQVWSFDETCTCSILRHDDTIEAKGYLYQRCCFSVCVRV